MGETLVDHVPSSDNPADLATKVISAGQKRNHLVSKIMYDLSN